MAVNFTIGGKLLYPLTSPPPKPEPKPDPKLIDKVVSYGDREVIVTVPFPDSIEMIVVLRNEHHIAPDTSFKSKKIISIQLDQEIQKQLVLASVEKPAWITGGAYPNGKKADFRVAYDPAHPLHNGRVFLNRQLADDLPYWTMRVEFSASKAGTCGLVQLTAAIEHILPMFHVEKLLGDFQLSRVDAAIDCIGVTPIDLIAHIPKPGKRMVYIGDHGKPESVYCYAEKKQPNVPPKSYSYKTTGPLRMLLYERRDYLLQMKQPPTYGNCPVTRIEVPMRWKKNRPLLTDISLIKNLFQGRRVAYAAAVANMASKGWQQYCMAALGAGTSGAMFTWVPGPGGKYEKAYLTSAGDLVDPLNWEKWDVGLEQAGIAALIQKAFAQS
ncbi:MAG: hypothetical protein V4533_12935 [Pseudomonadota bacterium]|jgi:hypothetical protein